MKKINLTFLSFTGAVIIFTGLLLFFNIHTSVSEVVNKTEEDVMREFCVLGEKITEFPFYVYKDGRSGENKFFPTGNMGDYENYQLYMYSKDNPYSSPECIKIVYKAAKNKKSGWAGLYWQYPVNNWGNIGRAYDLTLATKLTFYARGESGGEVINKFQVGGIDGRYRDSGVVSIGPVTLSKDWKQYTIDLKNIDNSIIISEEDKQCWPFMAPLSRIIGGFCWATDLRVNYGKDVIFYLDEIKFEKD